MKTRPLAHACIFSLRSSLALILLPLAGIIALSVVRPYDRASFISAAAEVTPGLERPADPVVLTGADVPSLTGLSPEQVVAFRYFNGVWEQIPVQVDERDFKDFGLVHNSTAWGYSKLVYVDPNTFAGPDSNPALDSNDEIVFMAKDAGERPSMFSEPAGVVTGSGVEVLIADPLGAGATGYVYFFRQAGGLDPVAGGQYVAYSFAPLSGDYKTTYNTQNGPNPENSTAASAFYRHRFADRWIEDEINIRAGGATQVDILDRHKFQFAPDDCMRTDEKFAEGQGAFFANKSGPVRAIRSYVGAVSGRATQRDHIMYERRQDVVSYLRVHSISGLMDFIDYSPAAQGMRYYNNLNTSGAVIDGAQDAISPGTLQWEMVEGAQGALIMAYVTDSNLGLPFSSYYLDSANPGDRQCTGDGYAYGSSGLWVNQGIPCTDDYKSCPGTANRLVSTRTIYYEAPGVTVSDAQRKHQQASTPLTFTTRPWRDSSPTPTPTPPPQPPPAAPSALTATAASTSQINLKWSDNSGNEDGFLVERCQGAGCANFAQVAQTGPNVTTFSNTGLAAGATYSYRVRAFSGTGQSGYTNVATATTQAPPPPPAAPINLVATTASASQINLKWTDKSTNEDGFRVERCQGSTCTNFVVIATVGANATSYQSTALAANTTYSYRVNSYNAGGNSAYTKIASATTKR